MDDKELTGETMEDFVRRLANMPLSTENLKSTWVPPDWEEIKDWWDDFVEQAREYCGVGYY